MLGIQQKFRFTSLIKTGLPRLVILLTLFLSATPGSSETALISLPDSDIRYSAEQINDSFNVPDWYPNDHPLMPKVVSHGVVPAVFACASCHLTSGSGHPESSALAGLPAAYIVRQMKAYQKFQRPSIAGVMINIARPMTDEDIWAAAEYFAALPPRKVQEVVEVEEVPVTYVNSRFMRLVVAEKATDEELIGERIITVPKDEVRVKARDPYATFITYIPDGMLELGKRIVTQGNKDSAACTSCHGADLQGTTVAPLIAGQHASYLVAQLRAYKEGTRRGEADPGSIMANNLKYFEDREILATAAYIASLVRN